MIDVFAATNPAFIAVLLRSFCEGYTKRANVGADYPLLFLVMPIVLTADVANTLQGTNAATGFLNWITRSPQVLIDFPLRMKHTTDFTNAAIAFAVRHGLLACDPEIRFVPSRAGLQREPSWPAADPRGRAMADARRLGHWLGELGSSRSAYYALGVTP